MDVEGNAAIGNSMNLSVNLCAFSMAMVNSAIKITCIFNAHTQNKSLTRCMYHNESRLIEAHES